MQANRAVWALAAGMAAAAAALFLVAVGGNNTTFVPMLDVPWWTLLIGFALAELCAMHLQFRGNTLTFTPDEILFVLGLFAIAPSSLLLAYVVGGAFMLGVIKRIPPFKLAFNVAVWSLSTVVAVFVFRMLADPVAGIGPRNWPAALLAAVAAALVSMGAITAAITLLEGRPGGIGRTVVSGLLGTVVDTLLGLGAVVMLAESPLHLVLVGGPVVVVLIAYHAYMSESSKTHKLEFLYNASELMTNADDREAGLLALLDFARQTFHAEIAEIVLLGDDTGSLYRTCCGPGEIALPLTTANPGVADALLAVAAATDEPGRYEPTGGSPLETRDGIAIGSAMVAALTHEGRMIGALFVARERGAAIETFDDDELRLFEAFANYLATMMEKSRLSASLARLRVLEQELAHQAFHDSLTGLANRALFHDHVDAALANVGTGQLAVLFIDIDDFKTVNDTMGHFAGDILLTEVAHRIEACVGSAGTAARLGGDEFAVLLPDTSHNLQGRAIADRILVALHDPIDLEGQLVFMHASIGIANSIGVEDAAQLMRNADVAMYTAKRNGKGRFDEFQPTMSLSVAKRHQVKSGLERALICNEFMLHYQPMIDIDSGSIVGTEALLRWQDPSRGLMLPSEFVGVAEETGLIVPIGRYVLREACRQAADWATTNPDLRVFVNLSARQFAEPDLVADVRHALAISGLAPHQLCLEMTETAMMHDIEDVKRTLFELKAMGVLIAIDDFGTGFSSLSYLRELPIDVLKIAKPIIDGICDSDEDEAFVRGIIELGHLFGLKVVAEGVEEIAQYDRLVEMGCDLAQGFYHSHSMEPDATGVLLRAEHDADAASGIVANVA